MDRPEYCTDEMLDYLDDLQESSRTNMFGAWEYLLDVFPQLDRYQAKQVNRYWMERKVLDGEDE